MKQLKDHPKKVTYNTTANNAKMLSTAPQKTDSRDQQVQFANYHNIGRRYSFDDNGGGYKGL